jgi:hypothetical protein
MLVCNPHFKALLTHNRDRHSSSLIHACLHLVVREKYEKVINWLYPEDTNSRHNDIRRQRLEGTGKWFLQRKELSQWLGGSHRLLWVHGIRLFLPQFSKVTTDNYILNSGCWKNFYKVENIFLLIEISANVAAPAVRL